MIDPAIAVIVLSVVLVVVSSVLSAVCGQKIFRGNDKPRDGRGPDRP